MNVFFFFFKLKFFDLIIAYNFFKKYQKFNKIKRMNQEQPPLEKKYSETEKKPLNSSSTQRRKKSTVQNETLEQILSKIANDFSEVEPIIYLSKAINVNPAYLILGGFMLLFVPINIGLFPSFFVGLLAMFYPSYMSIFAKKDRESVKQWLTYWVCFSFLELIDGVLCALFDVFLPFYYPIKALFLIWLFYPKSLGASLLYDKVFKNLFGKLKDLHDHTVGDAKTEEFFKKQE